MANEENLQRDIATLERALREAAKQADTVQSALDDLEGHRNELAGRLATAREAASDYEAQLEERRQALARALEAQAQAKLLEAVGERDDAANRVVEAIPQLIASIERLDAAREKVTERVAETQTHLGRRPEVAPDPEKLELEWARLINFVRERAQLALDIELVEAAVSSPLGHEIEKLPEHLQVIARRRWQERIRSARAGTGHHNRE
jgi:chromosome segregation ATPase